MTFKLDIRGRMRSFLDGSGETHIEKKKHRSKVILVTGLLFTAIMAIISLCIGQTAILAPWTALGALGSAILHGGSGLEGNALLVFEDRLPRTVAAIGVGVGLSVSGAAYQALIRNPLVDPYIMGVSSGAGTLAVATIAFDFTFFGLVSVHSPYLTAIAAALGGLMAFGLTMLLAQRAGKTTNAYVLAGVVVGLLFSAVQTVLIKFSGNKVASSMSWLFGSFANVSLTEACMIVVCGVAIIILIARKAKELNLVLLGDSQAKQMGLNVDRFNVIMLVLASVLASLCVAFCGIIGFVGLVVPHICRMIFGGDHRLVIPASIAFGGAVLLLADLVARMALYSQELPIGAITTLIGVPVFVYLLIMRGKMYNG